MSDGMGRELAYLSSHATNRYFIPNWGIILCFQRIGIRGTHVIIEHIGMRAVKSDERNSLLQILMRLLHFLNGGKGLVDSHQSLTADNTHASTLVYY